MKWIGNLAEDQAAYFRFSTHKADGTPITLAGTPALSVYKDDNDTQTTTGVTLSVDDDGVTGMHTVKIDTSDAFYAVGSDYSVVITTGTVDSVSVVGTVLATFSIENRFNEVDVTKWLGTAAHAATVNGVPVVQLHNSAGTGGINAPANFEDMSIADTTGLVATAATQHVIVDSGTVTTLTNLPAAPTDWLTAAAVKADAVTKIQAGLAQDIANECRGNGGTVWHIIYGADEHMSGTGYDGLSWDTAWETIGDGIETAIEAMAAGDVLLIGPGVFILGSVVIRQPAWTAVRGSGMDVTKVIVTTPTESYALRTGVYLSDLTLSGATTNQIGLVFDENGTGEAVDILVERVRADFPYDSIYCSGTGTKIVATFNDCKLVSDYDGLTCWSCAAGSVITATNMEIICQSSAYQTRGVMCDDADMTFWLYNPMVRAKTTLAAAEGIGIKVTKGAVYAFGGSVSGIGAGSSYDISQADPGIVVLHGTQYDRTKVFGTPIEHSGDNQVTPTTASKTGYALAASQHVIVDSGTVTTVTNQLTAQQIRDALKLAPTAGDPAAGSIDAYVDCLPATWVIPATAAEVGAVQTHGDSAWATATGFSTHSAADVKTAIEAAGSSVAAILEDTGTTLPGLIPTANQNADALLQRDVEEVEAAIVASGNKDCLAALVLQLRHSNTTDNAGYLTVYCTDNATEFAQVATASQSTTDTITGVSA